MFFDENEARVDLEDYRANGPQKETRMLLDAILARGVEEKTLLDIGGGVGAIQHALLNAGAVSAVNVDASSAFLRAAKEEAERHGHADKIAFHHANFVELAPSIAPADVVTLDRVICCYHDMVALVNASAERARKFFGLVFPKDSWWIKLGHPLLDFGLLIERNPMRTFIHATKDVDAVLNRNGLRRVFYRTTFVWQVMLYERDHT